MSRASAHAQCYGLVCILTQSADIIQRHVCLMCFETNIHCMQDVVVGTAAQWLIKPVLALFCASTIVSALGLPPAVGTGLTLVCLFCNALCLPRLHRLAAIPTSASKVMTPSAKCWPDSCVHQARPE